MPMRMPGKPKYSPSPSSPRRKGPPVPGVGAEKTRPVRLRGIHGETDNGHPLWRVSFLDLDHMGGWSWRIDEEGLRKILKFLSDMERLTWTEVRAQIAASKKRSGAKHKFIPSVNLCALARRRLTELELDDFEQVFRFRLGNMERLWGMFHEGVFYPIWWDPAHKVCPSGDRN